MREKGKIAEDKAEKFLKKHGYKIIERNFYCRFGEIDIIAEKEEYLVFVEVKLRKDDSFGGAAMAVDGNKQQKIKKAALYYLQKKKIEPAVRFDVVLITSSFEMIKKEDILLIENAFC